MTWPRTRVACGLRNGDSQVMNEHDDDLESQVHEHAVAETDTYPDTEEDLDAEVSDETDDEAEDRDLDDDEAEM